MEAKGQAPEKVCANCKNFRRIITEDGIVQRQYCELHRQQVFGHFKCSNNKFTPK